MQTRKPVSAVDAIVILLMFLSSGPTRTASGFVPREMMQDSFISNKPKLRGSRICKLTNKCGQQKGIGVYHVNSCDIHILHFLYLVSSLTSRFRRSLMSQAETFVRFPNFMCNKRMKAFKRCFTLIKNTSLKHWVADRSRPANSVKVGCCAVIFGLLRGRPL